MERFTLTHASIGKKALVAITGLVLFGFVIVHMLGKPAGIPGPRGPERLFARAAQGARAAVGGPPRPDRLGRRAYRDVAASGQAIGRGAPGRLSREARHRDHLRGTDDEVVGAADLLLHRVSPGPLDLARRRNGRVRPRPDDVYANVINGFRVPWVVAIYVVAQVMLGLHLHHGAWSLFQSLGLSHPRYDRARRWLPRAFAFAVVAGNIAMPLPC